MFRAGLVVVALVAFPASGAELKTLKGETIKGDVISVNDKEIVINTGTKQVTTPVGQVLALNLRDQPDKLDPKTPYIEIELTDGTLLRCAKVELKKKDARLILMQGQEATLPMAKIAYIINAAQDENLRKQFREKILAKKWNRDVLGINLDGTVNPIQGTLGDADEKGENIEFIRGTDGTKREVSLSKAAGFYFLRPPGAAAAPVLCKVHDGSRNMIYASKVTRDAQGYIVESSSGVTIKYAPENLVKLDYTTDKLAFLSQMIPTAVVETSTEGVVQHFKRDANLDGGVIRMAGVEYDFGLCIHATTEIEYDLKAAYREFKAVVGIDDDVGGDEEGVTVVRILAGDNTGAFKELTRMSVSRKDKERTRPLTLNVKDVEKLKIIVTSGDILDLGKHVTLADAKVTK